MIEDPFHLQKDTRVFILTSPLKDSHIIAKNKLRNQFKAFGYSPTIQNYPTAQQVNDPDWSFNLPVKESDVGMNGVLQWYAYWAVLLKARKLRKNFIVAFSSVSDFEKDITIKEIVKGNIPSESFVPLGKLTKNSRSRNGGDNIKTPHGFHFHDNVIIKGHRGLKAQLSLPQGRSSNGKVRVRNRWPNCGVFPHKIHVLDHIGAQNILDDIEFLKGTPDTLLF